MYKYSDYKLPFANPNLKLFVKIYFSYNNGSIDGRSRSLPSEKREINWAEIIRKKYERCD